MKNKCRCDFLEEIVGFSSPGEYERFQKYINEQVKKKNLIEVNLDKEYHKGLVYGGRWYKCSGCDEIWRLVEPDFPFTGLFEKVDK